MADAAEKPSAPKKLSDDILRDVATQIYRAWYTTEEAADYLRLTRAALLKHVERGALVPDNRRSLGRVAGFRFRRETLEQFMSGVADNDQE